MRPKSPQTPAFGRKMGKKACIFRARVVYSYCSMIDFGKWAAMVRFLFMIGGYCMDKAKKAQGEGAAARVERLVRPIVEGMGLKLWDVRFEKEGPDWFLRVLIDRDTPLDTDTCEAASRAIDPILDEADPIEQSYYLEVGSPGLGRRLTRPEHYEALKGQKCLAHFYRPDAQGRREISGLLVGLDGGTVTLDTPQGPVAFPLEAASYVKLCDDEDLF